MFKNFPLIQNLIFQMKSLNPTDTATNSLSLQFDERFINKFLIANIYRLIFISLCIFLYFLRRRWEASSSSPRSMERSANESRKIKKSIRHNRQPCFPPNLDDQLAIKFIETFWGYDCTLSRIVLSCAYPPESVSSNGSVLRWKKTAE